MYILGSHPDAPLRGARRTGARASGNHNGARSFARDGGVDGRGRGCRWRGVRLHGVTLWLRGIRWCRRDFLPAAGAGGDIGVIGLRRFAVIPIAGGGRRRTWRWCGRRRYIRIGIRMNRCRIEIPDARHYPPPAQKAVVVAVYPVATAPVMQVTPFEVANVAATMTMPTSFPSVRIGWLGEGKQGGGGERDNSQCRSQLHKWPRKLILLTATGHKLPVGLTVNISQSLVRICKWL